MDFQIRIAQKTPIPIDATLGCNKGETIALVGPSGSGKSTILRCIAGLHSAQSGRVDCNEETWFDSQNGVNLSPQKRSVGFVFQHYALFPHLSAEQNVIAALIHIPKSKQKQRASELLKLVRLNGLGARRPHQLSGGQQQRIAIARALARDPGLLLLDEPFSAVDQMTRKKLQRELAELRHSLNIPIVLVTHDLDDALLLADVLCILHHGKTLQVGSPLEVVNRPHSALVARLVGLTNLFEGTILNHNQTSKTTMIKWGELELEAAHAPNFAVGSEVSWVISPERVILHRRDRPSRGENENPVNGVIGSYVVLGESVSASVIVSGKVDTPMALTVSAHVARRNQLDQGEKISFSILKEGIHIMPKDQFHTK
ncbi:ABC transporter ATP-binding protein, partial [Pseudomonadota bacterium]